MNYLSVNYHGNELLPQLSRFIEQNHYSKSARSQQQVHVFSLTDPRTNQLVGACIYGKPMGRLSSETAIELRRFCLSPGQEKNTASFFLSRTITWLQKFEPRYNHILTFADPNKGHVGTIYKACNFVYDGEELSGNPRVVIAGDKVHHIRQYYDKKDGEYSKQALKLQEMVAKGQAQIVKQQRKLRFIYKLR